MARNGGGRQFDRLSSGSERRWVVFLKELTASTRLRRAKRATEREFYRLLRVTRTAAIEGVVAKRKKDPNASIEQDLGQIESLTKAMEGQPRPWLGDLIWSFVVASICIGLVVTLTTWQIERTGLALSVSANVIDLTAARDWPPRSGWTLSTTSAVTIGNAAKVDLRGFDPTFGVVTSPPTLKIGTTAARLDFDSISSGDVIHLECLDDGQFKLEIIRTSASNISFTTNGPATASSSAPFRGGSAIEAHFSGDVGTIVFHQDSNRPITLVGSAKDLKPALSGPVAKLSFADDQTSAGSLPEFASSILQGSAHVAEVDQKYELLPFDRLSLAGLMGNVAFSAGDRCVDIKFIGSATEIEIGHPPFATSAVPTQLGYLFRQQGIPYYLTIFGTLWAVFWGGLSWVRQRTFSQH